MRDLKLPPRVVDENCALRYYYSASSGNSLPTFWDNPVVPSAMVKDVLGFLTLADGPLGCPETTVRDYHYSLHNIPEESNSRGWLCLLRDTSLFLKYV